MAGRAERERDPALDARIKRTAWMIGGLAVFFYVGFLAWNVYRSTHGF